MFLGSRAWLVCRVDNLTFACEPMPRQCGIHTISQPSTASMACDSDSFTFLLLYFLYFQCSLLSHSELNWDISTEFGKIRGNQIYT
jgi:hypothetical protein